jgi:hypothetical protein
MSLGLVRLAGAALVLCAGLAAPAPARADWVQIVLTNRMVEAGRYGPILQVWRNGTITIFSVAAGEVPRRVALDEALAIDFVTEAMGLDPRRDRIDYCPGGTLGVTCNDPDRPDMDWPSAD